MKKLISLFCVIFIAHYVWAYDFLADALYYNITSPTTVEVTNSTGSSDAKSYSGDVIIPSAVTYNGKVYTITTIGNHAFQGCTGLTAITIPTSVTTIADVAFSECTDLTSITIPNSVTTINKGVFYGCTGLTAISIPNSVTTIEEQAFIYCSSLSVINIPHSVSKIGHLAFDGTAWYNNQPHGVIYINNILYAYNGTMPANTSIIVNSGVNSITGYAFYNCTGLTSITIPNSVTTIGSEVFEGCTSLTSITIPNSVTTIDEGTFFGCTGLTSVCIPNSVISIGSYAFYGCNALTQIRNNTVEPPQVMMYAFTGIDKSISVIVPSGSIEKYKTAVFWSDFSNIINVSAVDGIYYNITSPTTVEVTNSTGTPEAKSYSGNVIIPSTITYANRAYTVTAIGIYSFQDCTGLTAITIPNSVKTIGGEAFKGCTSLTSIMIPDSVTKIGDWAFIGCTGLSTITIPISATKIGFQAFHGTTWYNNQPDGVIYINNILTGYKGIMLPNTSILINSGVTSISERAFKECTNLTSITIPNSVATIGDGAFDGCIAIALIQSDAVEPPFVLGDAFNRVDKSIPFIVPSESLNKYKEAMGWKDFSYFSNTLNMTFVDGIYYNITSSTTVEVTNSIQPSGIKTYSGNIIIPSTVTLGNNNVYTVTSIGSAAFQDCRGLTAITIPNTVTKIGNNAFQSCTSLTEIMIPNYVTTIGNSAFQNCRGLTAITIPNSVTTIEYRAFSGCTGLTSIAIPNNATTIAWGAFYDCTNLISITIPNSVTAIGDLVFSGTKWYKNQPDGVIYINNVLYAYKGTMPANTSITVNSGVILITDKAFSGCTGLSSITIPNSVTTIGADAFRECAGLTSISIPESVVSIGHFAFDGCSNLTAIAFPTSITSIGYLAFHGTGWYNNQPEGFVYIHNNLYSYKGEMPPNTSLTVNEGVTSISGGAFYTCVNLTSIKLPNSLKKICTEAFGACIRLSSIVIPDSVTTIDALAFYSCENLTSISIPHSIKTIEERAFIECTALTSIIIRNNATKVRGVASSNFIENTLSDGITIGSGAFKNCTGLKSIDIPNNVREIDNEAFYNCTSLTGITISNSVSTIGENAFHETGWYNSQPNGVTYLSNILYRYKGIMPSNTSIAIKSGTTSISYGAFSDCTGLTSITIPNSVTTITEKAFQGCTGLTAITIPNRVKIISLDAFYGCRGLASITIPDSVTRIDDRAFSDCRGLTKITIPDSVTSIGKRAFSGCNSIAQIQSDAVNPPDVELDAFDGINKNIPLIVPLESVGKYKVAVGWKEFYNVLTRWATNPMNEVQFNIYSREKNIIIENAANHMISIFDILGRKLVEIKNPTNTETISFNKSGIYLIKIANRSAKVSLF